MINSNKTDMYRNTRTIIGNENQVTREFGLPYTVRKNSTLNQSLLIQENAAPPSTTIPVVNMMVLGVGGISATNCSPAGGLLPPSYLFYQHDPRSTGLFQICPIVVREVAQDLTPAERVKYRLRKQFEVNGVQYIGYYGKVIDTTNIRRETKIFTSKSDGTWDEADYVPTAANMKPQPQVYTPDEEQLLSASYSKTMALVPVSITAADVKEIKNAFNVIYGDPNAAVTTEIGLVSSVNRSLNIQTPQGQQTITEAIAAQICHVNTVLIHYAVFNEGFDRTFDMGITEPLFVFEK